MSWYEQHCLPHLINLACGSKPVRKQREKVVPLAHGRVLEVGMGSGLNLPFYRPEKVELVWGLEPSAAMRMKAQSNLQSAAVDVRWLACEGEAIPLDDDSADTVLLTYTLCTIAGWEAALSEMRRVLKPGGRLVFCEHGAAPDAGVARWQARINPLWRHVAGGCNLDRPIPRLLEMGGFRIESMETMYVPGPKIASFNYWGTAETV